ncbi:putative RNA helicase [Helianthus anomalus]
MFQQFVMDVWCLLIFYLITVVQGLFFSIEDDTRVYLLLNRQSSVCRSSVQGLMYYNFVYSSEKGGLDWKEKIVDCGRNLLFCLLRMSLQGRGYNVQIFYVEEPVSDCLRATVSTVMSVHDKEPMEVILIFLTGQDDIDTAVQLITEEAQNNGKSSLGMP